MAVLAGAAACATPAYRLNIERREDLGEAVRSAVRAVERDLPPNLDDEAQLEALALLQAVAAPEVPPLETARRQALAQKRGVLENRLRSEVVAVAWESTADGRSALHELTAGPVELPFDELVRRFPPAAEWGRSLYRYLGGELAVDAADAGGRPTLQRERMVIRPPWYAVGAPDLDMSKYEAVSYSDNEIRIDWTVTKSENGSVVRDDGYVAFRRFSPVVKPASPQGAQMTLVVFNSIHEVDPGWLGRLAWHGLRTSIGLRSLRDLFAGHVESYREKVPRAVASP